MSLTPKDRLRQARHLFNAAHPREREYTQNELGELAGFGRGTWGHWESGIKPFVRPSTIEQIAAMFARAGMPYITRIWLEHGISRPGDPVVPSLLTGDVTLDLSQVSKKDAETPVFPRAKVGKKFDGGRKKAVKKKRAS